MSVIAQSFWKTSNPAEYGISEILNIGRIILTEDGF